MTDLETGVMIGMLLTPKTVEPEPEHDSDHQKWLDLPDPNDNQAVFLIRITDDYNYCNLQISVDGANDSNIDAFSIDWGDGSETQIYKSATNVNYTYTTPGEYVVKITNIFSDKMGVVTVSTSTLLIMAKYGVGTYVLNTQQIYSLQNKYYLRYIRLPQATEFTEKFFYNCYSLREIEYDGEITELYTSMFENCRVLNFDTLKFKDISNVLNRTFYCCFALQSISLPNCISIGDYAFSGCYALQSVSLPNCISIGNSAFINCYTLQSISLPNCTTIGNSAFINCYTLQSISLPNCTTIGNYSLQNNFALETALLPNCTTIGNYAFNGCYALNELTVADDCTFGTNCFNNCYSLYPHPDGTV